MKKIDPISYKMKIKTDLIKDKIGLLDRKKKTEQTNINEQTNNGKIFFPKSEQRES